VASAAHNHVTMTRVLGWKASKGIVHRVVSPQGTPSPPFIPRLGLFVLSISNPQAAPRLPHSKRLCDWFVPEMSHWKM